MVETHVPSPARDLVRIHRVITRGLAMTWQNGNQFKQSGFPDEVTHQGFCDYSRSLAIVLDGHHTGEDNILFPTLQKKLPQAPYGHLSEQHKEIESRLVHVNKALNEMTGADGQGLDLLTNEIQAITEIWAPHIRMEESIFSEEALAEVMSPEELLHLSVEIGKHSQEASQPPYLIVPFVLLNAESEDRAALMANMPPTIMDELVMKAWKDKWAPMKPFMIE
jgi:hemerythrin-like domain-containing protein